MLQSPLPLFCCAAENSSAMPRLAPNSYSRSRLTRPTSLRKIESTGSRHPVSHDTTYTKPLTINEFHVVRKCVGWQRSPCSRRTHARTHMDPLCQAVLPLEQTD